MVVTLPINIPIPAENAIATYDFYSVATGTAYKTFYGIKTYIAAATVDYSLTTESYATSKEDEVMIATTTTKTYSVLFEVPTTLDGDCIVQVPYKILNGGVTGTVSLTALVELYKTIDGVTTDLATDVTATASQYMLASGYAEGFACVKMPITKNVLKAGTTLYLKITLTSAGNSVLLYNDPATTTKALKLNLPVVISK
jgi:hypothetical protein